MSFEKKSEQRYTRDYSRDERFQRSRFDSGSSFSRADVVQNWRERSDNAMTNQATSFGSSSKSQEETNKEKHDLRQVFYNVPRLQQIKEDKRLLDHFRRSMTYLGNYSEDSEANYSLEKCGFHYLDLQFRPDEDSKLKEVDFDLKEASEKAKPFTPTGKMLFENMITWIASQPDVLSSLKIDPYKVRRAEATFVARDGLFKEILKILDTRYSIDFCATFISGTVYMEYIIPENFLKPKSDNEEEEVEKVQSEEKVEKVQSEEEVEKIQSQEKDIHKWSHKYEQYMCGENLTRGTVPNEQFRTVITSNLGPHKLLYCTPTDAVNPNLYEEGVNDLSAFVKLFLTTMKYSEDPKNYFNIIKPLEWALTVLFGGVKEMIAGFCNDDGIASELRLFTLDDLLIRGQVIKNVNKYLTFGMDILDFVKNVTELNPGSTFFFIQFGNRLKCRKVDDKFVPDWFIDKLNASN